MILLNLNTRKKFSLLETEVAFLNVVVYEIFDFMLKMQGQGVLAGIGALRDVFLSVDFDNVVNVRYVLIFDIRDSITGVSRLG